MLFSLKKIGDFRVAEVFSKKYPFFHLIAQLRFSDKNFGFFKSKKHLILSRKRKHLIFSRKKTPDFVHVSN